MPALEELFTDPRMAIGYGLLASRENPMGAALGFMQQGQEMKLRQQDRDVRNKLLERQLGSFDLREREFANKLERQQQRDAMFAKARQLEDVDPAAAAEMYETFALENRDPVSMTKAEALRKQAALAALPTTMRPPMGQPMQEPMTQPEPRGFLDLGAPQSAGGQAFMDMGQPEQLPPLQGMENLPAMPQEGNDRMSRILQEMEIEGAREAAGDPMAKGRMMRLKEELDFIESQIPSPTEQLKIDEASKQNQKAGQIASEGLYYAKRLLANRQGLADATGPIAQYIPNVYPASADAAEDLAALQNVLTVENLGMMSGVLSESDIKLLQAVAAGGLGAGRSEGRLVSEIERVVEKLEKAKFEEPVIMENHPEYGTIKESDILETMRANGMTRGEVFDLLGVK